MSAARGTYDGTASAVRRLMAWVAGAVFFVCAAVAAAQPAEPGAVAEPADPVRQRFVRATEAMAAGHYARAAEEFVAVAGSAPEHVLASDSLFTAAKLYEERLMDPARALVLYRRLIEQYPSSRTALAAERRAEDIARMLGAAGDGGGDQGDAASMQRDMEAATRALARFTDILQAYTERGEAESLAMAEQLLRENPGWPGAARVFAWVASVHQRAGRWPEALSLYKQAIEAAPEGDVELLFTAYRGAGDVELAMGRLAAAERYYRLLPARGDISRALGQADALAALSRARAREHWYDVSVAVVALMILVLLVSLRWAAGSASVAWRVLRRPPTEVIFMMPIAAVLIVASLTGHHAIFPAVAIICMGGMAIAWLSGAGLVAASVTGAGRPRLRTLVHATAVMLAVVALCYIAIHRNRLIDIILDTVRFGPEL